MSHETDKQFESLRDLQVTPPDSVWAGIQEELDARTTDAAFAPLQDLETTPPPAVWDAIQAQMDEKQGKRRVVPIWWWAGSAAAILLVALLGYNLINDSATDAPAIVAPSADEEPFMQFPSQDGTGKLLVPKQESVTDADAALPRENSTDALVTPIGQSQLAGSDDTVSNPASGEAHAAFGSASGDQHRSAVQTNEAVVNGTRRYPPQSNQEEIESRFRGSDNPLTRITAISKTDNTQPQSPVSGLPADAAKTQLVVVENSNPTQETEQQTASPEAGQNITNAVAGNPMDSSNTQPVVTEPEGEGRDLMEAVAEQENPEQSESEDAQEDDAITDRWSVATLASAVAYDASGNGSSLGAEFADNAQGGSTNLAYGVQIGYEINDRLQLRTGISRVSTQYDVSDVAVASTFSATELSAGTARTKSNFVIMDVAQPVINNPFGIYATGEFGNQGASNTGQLNMVQQYLEVPVELSYKLLDRRFSIAVSGGVSSLILTDDSMLVQLQGGRVDLGRSDNLNNLSFTANAGIGLAYEVSKQFDLLLEPAFKYQLNAFTNTAGSFNPYFLSVGSGIRYRF